MLEFDIISPVFNSGSVLGSCIRSVSDQGEGVRHFIQDGESTDRDTCEILGRYAECVESRPDVGMYHALNLAIQRGHGAIVGHLNADEQYLPGILERVRKRFEMNPDIDVVCGDMVVTDTNWNPLAYRTSVLPPSGFVGRAPLPLPTCGMFISRRLFDLGLKYRDDLRAIGDAVLVDDLIRLKARWYFDPAPYALFSIHEKNLSNSGAQEYDHRVLGYQASILEEGFCRTQVWLRKLVAGAYRSRNFEFLVYEHHSAESRVKKISGPLSWKWPTGVNGW